jgi:ABC-2 type transport system ATP-binding protein
MVSGGESSGYGLLTVRENLWMFAQFYGIDYGATRKRIDELLEVVGLTDRANTKTSDLSTGMRQKMNIVRGFLTDPAVIFLDEPTLGLDVGASRDVRNFIRNWAAARSGRTMLLTTHYMAEADELCDRVAIVNAGRVLACDSPANLKKRLRREALFHLELSPLTVDVAEFNTLPGLRKIVHTPRDGKSELELILDADDAIAGVINKLATQHIRILNLQKREPTLEDVFLDLVGMSLAEAEKTQ